MRNVERIVILYPGETSSERINKPANYSFSRLLLQLHERDPVPVYFLSQSKGHEQYGNIEFIHMNWRSYLQLVRRFAFARNTLIITQTPAYLRYALVLRFLLPSSKLIVRLGGVYYGAPHLESAQFANEVRSGLRRLREADMVISTADGTPVDLYMQRVGIEESRYRKWINGFPVVNNRNGYARSDQIVCISRLSAEKGIDYVIESYARALPLLNRGHKLRIVGDGAERENLQALSQRLGVGESVEFIGDSFDIEQHLYTSKLLVSGLANNPIMEAIATETPVVAVELGETRKLYGHFPNVHVVSYPPGGCGRIDPGHRERLIQETAVAIADVLNDADGPDDLSDRPPLFTWDERLQLELELYDSLFDEAPA